MQGAKAALRALIPAPMLPRVRVWYHWLSVLQYRGFRHYCPCCNRRFRRFLPFGAVPWTRRENALCPYCWALERQRMLWLYLRDYTSLRTDRLRVLHFAPEPSLTRNLERLSNLEYITVDLEAPHTTMKIDIAAIPFLPQTIDVVLCSHVLEHVPDDRQAMREIARVLRPNGWAILLVPIDRQRAETFEDPSVTDPCERARLFNQEDHVRVYGRDYKDRLEEAGFTVRVIPFARQMPAARRRLFGLRIDEEIYLCTVCHAS